MNVPRKQHSELRVRRIQLDLAIIFELGDNSTQPILATGYHNALEINCSAKFDSSYAMIRLTRSSLYIQIPIQRTKSDDQNTLYKVYVVIETVFFIFRVSWTFKISTL